MCSQKIVFLKEKVFPFVYLHTAQIYIPWRASSFPWLEFLCNWNIIHSLPFLKINIYFNHFPDTSVDCIFYCFQQKNRVQSDSNQPLFSYCHQGKGAGSNQTVQSATEVNKKINVHEKDDATVFHPDRIKKSIFYLKVGQQADNLMDCWCVFNSTSLKCFGYQKIF